MFGIASASISRHSTKLVAGVHQQLARSAWRRVSPASSAITQQTFSTNVLEETQSVEAGVEGVDVLQQYGIPSNVIVEDLDVFLVDESAFAYNSAPWEVETTQVPVLSFSNSTQVGDATLVKDIFGEHVNQAILHETVRWQLAGRRAGTSKVKTIAERNGTGRKPHAQKGTGRARQGSKFAPHMRGGGRVHGPTGYRDFSFKLNKKFIRKAVRTSLSAKFQEGNLCVVDSFKGLVSHSRDLTKFMDDNDMVSALFVDGFMLDRALRGAASTHPDAHAVSHHGCMVYEMLRYEKTVLSLEALHILQDRLLKRPIYWPNPATNPVFLNN